MIGLLLARFSIASVMALALAGAAFAQPMDRLRHLELTDAQQDQVFGIYHDQAPEMRQRVKAARRAHQELRQSAKAVPFDRDRARQFADAEGKAVAQIALMRAEAMSRVRAVLTEEQRAKLDAGRAGPK